MKPAELEQLLRDLPKIGTVIKDRGYRQIWRFEAAGRGYFLKFYPKHGLRDFCRRLLRGSPARLEFERLQKLQRAKIPSPRAVALLMGFKLNNRIGDAVVIEAIEPSISLGDYLMKFNLSGEPIPNRRGLMQQILGLVQQLGAAGLGHADLNLGNFLLHDGKLFLIDGYSVRDGGLTTDHVRRLANSSVRFATTSDLLRGWRALVPDSPMPKHNSQSSAIWRSFLKTIWQENRYFGRLQYKEWKGFFFKRQAFPLRRSVVSQMEISVDDWNRELPRLMTQIESDLLKIFKRSRSGDVLEAEVTLNHRPVIVILKRPKKRKWIRYINQIGRGTRAHREWKKSWQAIARGWPVAWPMLLLERRVCGYLVDSIIVYEKVHGKTLESASLDDMPADQRDMLMRRTGKILRKIEQAGWAHFDAKASNWMVCDDAPFGLRPIMIDIDGIRHRRWRALGIKRLLRSMKFNKTFRAQDAQALCRGYSPWEVKPFEKDVMKSS